MSDQEDDNEEHDDQWDETPHDEEEHDIVDDETPDHETHSDSYSNAPLEPQEEEDPGVSKDLAYYVDKIAKTLANKKDDPADASQFSDSGSDEEMPDQPLQGDNLQHSHMKHLLSTMKQSAPYRETNLGLSRMVCLAPAKFFVNIKNIRDFRNLRCVDLSRNYLRDFSALNQLPFLGTVKLHTNGIRNIATLRSKSYRFLDLSNNKIKNLEGAYFPRISRLKLNYNRIRSTDAFKDLHIQWLYKLELRGNGLKSTAGIQHPLLEELYLAENDIREIEGLENCPSLRRLHLRDNQILQVTGLSRKNTKLEYVNLRNNLITFLDEAVGVSVLPKIQTVIMLDNPVQLEQDYRMVMVARMQSLRILDKEEIQPYDRDWCIMTLLDCLYHEETDLHTAVSDLFDTLTPNEVPDMDDFPMAENKDITVVVPKDDKAVAASDVIKDVTDDVIMDEAEKVAVPTPQDDESDDDLKRRYWGEEAGDGENEENEEAD